jgi:lipopolysaccharide transport system ATP-binding protein
MSDPAISVRNLGKRYVLGALRRSARSSLGLRGLFGSDGSGSGKDFWALRRVEFDVRPGEVVGIVGRNGAGKSTLLKLLSRITEPTEGSIRLRGRVGSLLEVGTGFHPELSGRENVFLNGAILGMRHAEISRRFDEIVAFADMAGFIDTPVRRYSSGMFMRLAFSVAAHLDTEILIVDEVLAVGDAGFQRKCLGKMGDIAGHGRTVLFVSHNLQAVRRLCNRCVLLKAGAVVSDGPTEEVLAAYAADAEPSGAERTWPDGPSAPGDDRVRLRAVRLIGGDGRPGCVFDSRSPITVEIDIRVLRPLDNLRLSIRLLCDGEVVFTSTDHSHKGRAQNRIPGMYRSRCVLPGSLLNGHRYSVTVGADVPFQDVLYLEEAAVGFSVDMAEGVSGLYAESWPGYVCPELKWSSEMLSAERAGDVA